MNQRENFKSLIKSVRIKFNWTQSEMAKMLGVTQAAVCKWEKRGSISLINYLKLQQKLTQLPDCSGSMSSLVAVSTVNDEQQPSSHS
ncbi:helix-turn-helix transcriptional regulator [Bartonella sp. CB74]|uniref:helix-turn-helix transcriptional regulator n=1 Tax=Bartonella sp. CB74 TaxID=3113620 RepID=UPI002F965F75